jgi:anti-sigma factor RsiW
MTTDQHLNTGAMALGSLPEEEAASFGDHLSTCEVCAAELESFRETAAILGSSVAQTPPAGLRRAVMEAISRTPQLPPLTDPTSGTDAALGRHREAAVPDEDLPASPTEQPTEELATVIPLHRPWYRRTQGLIAAAIALLVIGGGAGVVIANHNSPAAQTADAACVAAAPDKSALAPTVGTGGDVSFAPSCNTAVVNMPKLPPPPAGKVYQLWVLSGQKATSVGVVDQNSDGSVPAVTTPVHAGNTAVGVTLEPAPGPSPQPTSKPLWVVPLSA